MFITSYGYSWIITSTTRYEVTGVLFFVCIGYFVFFVNSCLFRSYLSFVSFSRFGWSISASYSSLNFAFVWHIYCLFWKRKIFFTINKRWWRIGYIFLLLFSSNISSISFVVCFCSPESTYPLNCTRNVPYIWSIYCSF